MDLKQMDNTRWVYTDALRNKYELSVDMRRTQDETFSLHCHLETTLGDSKKKPHWIELHIRPLPVHVLECIASRPQTRQWSNKKLLVSNYTDKNTSTIIFYEGVNPQTKPVHDIFCEFAYKQCDNYDYSENECEEPLLFEFSLTVCCERTWWQAFKGDDNQFFFEPVHVKINERRV